MVSGTFHLGLYFLVLAHVLAEAALPEISFDKLSEAVKSRPALDELKDAGGKWSAFAVTDVPPPADFAAHMRKFRDKAPMCVGHDADLPSVELSDGSSRRTFATESGDNFPACFGQAMKTLAAGFDAVEDLVTELVQTAIGRELSYTYVAGKKGEKKAKLADSPRKDHIHVYAANASRKEPSSDYLVPFHVDNGLFLLITPFPDLGLMLQLSDGRTNVSTAHLSDDSVLVLFGLGMDRWLLQDLPETPFYAVPHAVPAMTKKAGLSHRSVYARMKVAPSKAKPALPEDSPYPRTKLRTFNEVFMATNPAAGSDDSQVCSIDLSKRRHKTNRDPWLIAMDTNCQEGEAYCWMGCYPLPADCPSVDGAMCFSKVTNVSCSTDPDGKPMDPTCKWHCRPEDDEEAAPRQLNDYCNGRMDMLMFGFETSGQKKNPCIILFVESWTLDSKSKFCCACFGVLLLGLTIEALIALRRLVSRRQFIFADLTELQRKCLSVACFATNLVLGYLAMLVAMTYSIELFACVVLGLVLGHALFNVNSAVGETVDPCCTGQNDPCRVKSCRRRGGRNNSDDAEAEGAMLILKEEPSPSQSSNVLLTPPSVANVGNGEAGGCCGGGANKEPAAVMDAKV